RPRRVSNRTPEAVEGKILALRAQQPGWGARKLKVVLERSGEADIPCERTICRILRRHGCIDPEESRKRQPFQRFEREHCNELWQADFKGEFRTLDGRYCYPLNIIDDHSRFVLRIEAADSTAQMAIPVFEAAFREYGLPQAILSDNGAQFAGFRQGYTRFEKWLMDLGVLPIHGRIGHPQTQGKIERFHGTMKREFLRHRSFADAKQAHEELQRWRHTYNMQRPHEALGMRCPGEVYVRSRRRFPKSIRPIEYTGRFHITKVNNWGYVRFTGFQTYLSETRVGCPIELRPSEEGEVIIACYRRFKIAEFSAKDGSLVRRKISRL
ncbi:MAG: IS481 family transposase, partial [Ottowia sp.]|nr:IS481 family transposase [Ottowia sp.]